MRDSVLKRAILISVAVHLVAIGFIGRTSDTRLSAASIVATPQRLLNVDLVKDPLAEPPKPKPAPVVRPDAPTRIPTIAGPLPGHRSLPTPVTNHTAHPNAGGSLNTGTPDPNGDISAGPSGKTPSGYVPGPDNGKGNGSGTGPGIGTPEPIRPSPPRHQDPIPAPPPPPPAPKKVTVRVCDVSGLLAGKYCDRTHNATFTEGDEPHRTCDRCKAPEPKHNSRIADVTKPVRLSKINPVIPASVEEGKTFHVEIEFYSDTNGGVSEVHVTKSSGNRAVDRAVVADALKWRYKPATQDGVPQRVPVVQPIDIKT